MIYVMSDIHGHRARYESIMSQINLQPDDHLYVLGDCIDRHPDGLEILKELYYMPNATVLLGNHEHMMLQALGENPKRVYNDRDETPVTRMATAAVIREGLAKAKRYLGDLNEYENDSENSDLPELDVKCEALVPLLKGEISVENALETVAKITGDWKDINAL